jgi:hypothetical protein
MAQRGFRSVFDGENVLGFARLSPPNTGAQALDLVYQAADVFRSIEDRARETEARAEAAERAQRQSQSASYKTPVRPWRMRKSASRLSKIN